MTASIHKTLIGLFRVNHLLAFLLAATIPAIAIAQDSTEEESEERVEKIEVTGSHIKRIDVEGPSPILTLDREALDQSGYNSVSDALREQAIVSFGSVRENSGSTVAGVATVNLRGLGSSRTLVLLNGKRLPTDAVGGYVDLNLVPMAAVERIEILKDGASATYGSDALGGVVNIITRKEFNAFELSSRMYVTELGGGNKTEMNAVTGTTSNRGSAIAVFAYRKNEDLFSKDRKWSEVGRSTLGSPGSYRAGTLTDNNTPTTPNDASDDTFTATGNWTADANCPAGQILTTTSGQQYCTFNFAEFSSELPTIEQTSFLTDFTYDIKESLTVFGRLGAIKKNADWQYAPAPGIFKIPSSVADTINNGTTLPGVTAGSDLEVRYRTVELGNRKSEITTTSFMVLGGLKGQLGDTWDWEVTSYATEINRLDLSTSGYALSNKLTQLIADGDFNPFAASGSRDPNNKLDSAFYQPWQRSISRLNATEIKFTGEAFELGDAAVGTAIGVQTTQEYFLDQNDNLSVEGQVFSSAGSSGEGSRSSISVYNEWGIPVTDSLEFQLAARYDDYSDFGSTTNPKAALRWQIMPSLMVRASAGTGFKAPQMQDLYASDSFGYPTFVDQVACDRDGAGATSCEPAQYLVQSSGNTGLQEETSTSTNLGVLYQPNNNFSFGTDFWSIQMDNIVGISYEELTRAELNGVDETQYGVEVQRDANGDITQIIAPLQNLSSQTVQGVDFAMNYGWLTGYGKMSVDVQHSLMLNYETEGFPGAGARNVLNENGNPAWRNVTSFSWMPNNAHSMSLTARTIAGQEKSAPDTVDDGFLDDYTELDFQYVYNAKWDGQFTLGVKNLESKTPPLDDSNINGKLNKSLYDQLGRLVYVGYKQTF